MSYLRLTRLAAAWAFLVIVVGAFVRLSDAGLGCPDWPGCYGAVTPLHAAADIAAAEAAEPHGPVSHAKAWKEMIHRYLAATLGFLILAIAAIAWRRRGEDGTPWLPLALVGVVLFQGALGMWTVTLLLKPAIVTLHLIGGMTTLALLVWLALTRGPRPSATPGMDAVRLPAALALAALALQVTLGGWTSTNYAALACGDFPLCQGQLLPEMDFGHAFHVMRELGMTATGTLLPLEALTAIHWTHRLGAVLATLALAWAAWRALSVPALAGLGLLIAAALVVQLGLGIANVLLRLPLVLAVAHNAGAALLVALVVALNVRARSPSMFS